MRFTSIINLPVIVLALVIGAAATPTVDSSGNKDPLVQGLSHPTLLLFVLTRPRKQ